MSPLEEKIDLYREERGQNEGWSSKCLAKFNWCLGMPTEGYEEEILYLLRRMKGRIDHKRQDRATRKTILKSSKSNRELKKLEWTISYKKKLNWVLVWVFLEGLPDWATNKDKNLTVEY